MTLYLMIPCYNEAATLEGVLLELPSTIPDILQLKVLVVDDGSTDESATIAAQCGAEVLRLEHVGLAQAYYAGLRTAVARGADFVVTLDADGQYDPEAIGRMLEPLLQNEADIILGERGETFYRRLKPRRRLLHRFGAWGVRRVTGLPVEDPVTGYRAYTRDAIQRLQVRSRFTYTLEMLVQVPLLGLRLACITAEPRLPTRPSKVVKHPLIYSARQLQTLLWAAVYYRSTLRGIENPVEEQDELSADFA